jgi:uncharacterized protein
MLKRLIELSMDYPRAMLWTIFILTIGFSVQFVKIKIDTDPENMLPADQADRVLYNEVKKNFGINDLIVFGITDHQGVFRTETLSRISKVIDGILKIDGVITDDVVSLTTTNDVQSKGGLLEVRQILHEIPSQDIDGISIHRAISDNPLLAEKVASADGKGVAIYVPIVSKDQAARIGHLIKEVAEAELGDDQNYYLAGLPIAEDVFGMEMFIQMAIMSPVSGMMIFLLLWFLFRKVTLVLPVMAVAMCTVAWGMGLLIGMGFTVHIMSSMIPVFLMPIAVLDSVHILSDFYDRYPAIGDRRETLRQTIHELYTPMLFTSITSSVGFASLMLAPIPPIQVFGGFVAIGILIAWIMTLTFVPASIMLISEEKLQQQLADIKTDDSDLTKILERFGAFVYRKAMTIAVTAGIILGVGAYGVSIATVNDNPVNWFAKGHEIRVADDVMNEMFGGTYMSYLILESRVDDDMKRPDVMKYMASLQRVLEKDPAVGKTSSVADIISQINYVLHDTDLNYRQLPETREEIAQYLFLYQMSGDAGDLDNFIDYDYRSANIWVQMTQGDNMIMGRVKDRVDKFIRVNPPPMGIQVKWSGLAYINKVWQDLMVDGMINAILGGFLAVLILMTFLFRSFMLAVLSMLPLTFAITLTYGLASFVGRDYDMPIAVCSSLTLGLSVDFAIHFMQRYRTYMENHNDLEIVNKLIFGETARAISRNAFVVAVGFFPMALSHLGPYKTVGLFFAFLMLFSSLTTLGLLPGLLKLTHGRLWGFRINLKIKSKGGELK